MPDHSDKSPQAQAETAPDPTTEKRRRRVSLFSGSGIGLLVGVLMGLAVSPTVGIIIGALASSLALILGLNDAHFSEAKALRIGSFGFVCVAGALLGIYVRSHNLLAPDLQTQLQDYVSVGFTKEEARSFIANTKFGIMDPAWRMAQAPATASADEEGKPTASGSLSVPLAQAQGASVLFSSRVDTGVCELLKEVNEETVLDQFYVLGGIWKRSVLAVEKDLDAGLQAKALMAFKDSVCGADGEAIEFKNCDSLASLNAQSGQAELLRRFAAAGPSWVRISDSVEQGIPAQSQSRVLRTLARVICDDNKD